MKHSIGVLPKRIQSILPDQRGITGLETAIALIAFVVVSSVFAFAALSTGLFSSDKAKETIQAGLAETRGSMELKGSVILTMTTTGTSGVVSDIAFQVSNAAGGSERTDSELFESILFVTGPDSLRNRVDRHCLT